MKIVIIDDEPMVREDLRHLLGVHPDLEIVGEAGTVQEARQLLAGLQVDAVFLDIQLIGGSGFDLVPDISPTVQIIFFTSYDEYAVRAFEINALDYLLKPISTARLDDTLDRLRAQGKKRPDLLPPTERCTGDDRIFIATETEQRFIQVADILAVSSVGGNYSVVHRRGHSVHMVRRTLKRWENVLPPEVFLRIHRSTIVSLGDIESLHKAENGSHQVVVAGIEQPFTVSRRVVNRLKRIIAAY